MASTELADQSGGRSRIRRFASFLSQDQCFYLIFGAFLAYHAGLMLATRLFPFIDLPSHMAMATVLRYYHAPGTPFADTFVLDLWLKANVFHLFFCAAPIFPSVEFANRVFYALYAALVPLSALAVIRRVGGNRWHALLAVLLIHNYNVVWGFTGYTFAIPLVLFTLALIHRYTYEGGAWRGVGLAAALVGLFFVHLLAALFGILIHAAGCLACPEGFRKNFLKRAAVLVPVLVVIAFWWMDGQAGSEGTVHYLRDYYKNEFLSTFKYRDVLFFNDQSMVLDGRDGRTLGKALNGFLMLMALLPVLWRPWRLRATLAGRRLFPVLAFTLCGVACYVFLPPNLPINAVLHQRFSCYFFLGLVVLGGVLAPEATHFNRARVIVVAVLIYTALWTGFYREFNEVNKGFTPRLMPKSGFVAVATRDRFHGLGVYGAWSNYYIIWCKRLGVTSIQFFSKLIMAQRPGTPPLLGPAWLFKDDPPGKSSALARPIETLLIRGKMKPESLPLDATAKLVKQEGDWAAYRLERK